MNASLASSLAPSSAASESVVRVSDRQDHRMSVLEKCVSDAGFNPESLTLVAGDASFRKYYRVTRAGDQKSAIVMDAPPEKEAVEPFVVITEWLRKAGIAAPEILYADRGNGLLVLEDLGDALFARVLETGESDETTLYRSAMNTLIQFQQSDVSSLGDFPKHDAAKLHDEAMRFAEWFLPQALGREKAIALMPSWRALWDELIAANPTKCDCFSHHDYHAENLLWLPEREGNRRVGVLDYQDAKLGDAALDVVSLLQDARRDVSEALAKAMLDYYIEQSGEDEAAFRQRYAFLGAQRNLRIIGVFTRLALRDQKPRYLGLLPRVWGHVMTTMSAPELAPLASWLEEHVPLEKRFLDAVDPAHGHLAAEGQ